MKPSTLIVMSIGLVIAIVGFALCFTAQRNADRNYPDKDLFSKDGENYIYVDGDTVRTVDFSDVIHVTNEDKIEDVKQDVKVLSLTLKDVDKVEIVGRSSSSMVKVYNMRPGFYACEISSGVMKVSNRFDESLSYNYIYDVISNFNGIRRYFNREYFNTGKTKVIVTVNDDDLLNRIELDLTNCKDVTVKNLTCSLDCHLTLNNSNVVFDTCTFKEPTVEYPEPDPTKLDEQGNVIVPDPIVTNYTFSVDLNMKNDSNFDANACRFSSFDAIVNKKQITAEDVEASEGAYTDEQIGTYVSNSGKKCKLSLDLTLSDVLYGYQIYNLPDAENADDVSLVTVINGYAQGEVYLSNAGDKDFPQININASNCEIRIDI